MSRGIFPGDWFGEVNSRIKRCVIKVEKIAHTWSETMDVPSENIGIITAVLNYMIM
jgi:hypothetical protein